MSAPDLPPGLPDDLPDDTGHHTWQRIHAARERVRDSATERGSLTWPLVLLERVYAALAARPGDLAEMLDKVADTAAAWADAVRRRDAAGPEGRP
ncbi:hypothetical protein [Actinomadura sp. K4S16]|uniref:hypothetical protein n=1 Tax=Actinomadura sp. K4S16 TaxID=1316147 RepID=UPI0011ED1318|nr:hypothetical protein [Actinomadura sp. K4S16]